VQFDSTARLAVPLTGDPGDVQSTDRFLAGIRVGIFGL
jgi:hypothetical protein